MKETVLFPGMYVLVCQCGGRYNPTRVLKKKTFQNYCWYCKGNGRFVKLIEMEDLEFSYNWNNKLNCKSFSTLRLRDDGKYYVGAKKNVLLKGRVKGQATIKAVSHLTLDRINDSIALLDTGYSAAECRSVIMDMYKKKRPEIDWFTQQLTFSVLAYDEKVGGDAPDLFDSIK